MITEIKSDCRHFRGEIPCAPNKLRNKICDSCDEYEKITHRILIIKLGAAGDVIRSTPLAVRLKKEFPGCHITWLTHTPEALPSSQIDSIRKFDYINLFTLSHQHFDIAINLDKDREACVLLSVVNASNKYGFFWNKSHVDAINPESKNKLLTGVFDNLSKENKKSYQEEIFEMCGYVFEKEPYLLNVNNTLVKKWSALKIKAEGKPVIGLNTGCGKRWTTRLWPKEYWFKLIKKLQKNKYYPVLMGGPDEDEMNKMYTRKTGAYYPGTFSLEEFIALTANCDVVVTAVTMMMHIAIGLRKPLVLFNNIFNKHEFELYGNGKILEPSSGCDCYYGLTCKRERHCMFDISLEEVLCTIVKLAGKRK